MRPLRGVRRRASRALRFLWLYTIGIRRIIKITIARRGLSDVLVGALVGLSILLLSLEYGGLTAVRNGFLAGIAWSGLGGLRFGITGASAALPTIAFFLCVFAFPHSTMSENFYSTTAQVIPTLLVAFVLEGRVLRTKASFQVRVLAGQLALCLLVGETAALIGLSEGSEGTGDGYLPLIAGGLAAGFLAIILAIFIPEPAEFKNELVVSQDGSADHIRIGDAIRAADPGTVIRVRPGLYREGLIVTKPRLHIIGEGSKDEAIIEARGGKDALLFDTTYGKVERLTLRHAGDKRWSKTNAFGVDTLSGTLELTDCNIKSQVMAALSIRLGADPRVTKCEIQGGNQGVILVYSQGRGNIEECDLFHARMTIVEIRTWGDPVLRRNRIYSGKLGGVYVHADGRGTIEDNEIFKNGDHGLDVKDWGDPVVRRNRIYENKPAGVYVHADGRGTIEDNEIYQNAKGGLVLDNAEPAVSHNNIHNNGIEAASASTP
jgi:parallel beta-helix repeat protein